MLIETICDGFFGPTSNGENDYKWDFFDSWRVCICNGHWGIHCVLFVLSVEYQKLLVDSTGDETSQ